MLVSRNVLHVVSALQSIVWFWLIRSLVDHMLAAFSIWVSRRRTASRWAKRSGVEDSSWLARVSREAARKLSTWQRRLRQPLVEYSSCFTKGLNKGSSCAHEFRNIILFCICRLLLIIVEVVLLILGQLQRLQPWRQAWLHSPFKQSKLVTMGCKEGGMGSSARALPFLYLGYVSQDR